MRKFGILVVGLGPRLGVVTPRMFLGWLEPVAMEVVE